MTKSEEQRIQLHQENTKLIGVPNNDQAEFAAKI